MKKKITKQEFDAVKILLKNGATYDECSKYFQISSNTVWNIKRCENWTEYQNMLTKRSLEAKEQYKKKKEPMAIPVKEKEEKPVPGISHTVLKPSDPLIGNYQTNRLIELLKEQNEHLKLISNKLAFIVESLS